MRRCIPNVKCGIWRSYLGPKKRIWVVKTFSKARDDVSNEVRAGLPSTSKTDNKIGEVENIILANRRINAGEVGEAVNILIGLCH